MIRSTPLFRLLRPALVAFIDDHLEVHGVEPICEVLPIAPSTYYDHLARHADPARLSDRARRVEALPSEILRVLEENWRVYGVRRVWQQLGREGFDVARCTVARLMIECNLITPLIRQRAVDLPPVVTIFAIITFGILFGPLGIPLTTPLAVVCFVLVKTLRVRVVLDEETELPGNSERPETRDLQGTRTSNECRITVLLSDARTQLCR